MKQVLQNLRQGDTELVDVPIPQCTHGSLLIQTHKTLVSAGTERMLVEFGKAGLINKARQQPEKVRMVLDKIKTDGLLPTLEAVKNKLDIPLPLGYCNVGTVLEVGAGVTDIKPGDRVISNGHHAEIVTVPRNLCAPIPEDVDDETASFTVLGAIALQGIRLAQPTLGETFVVMGLGLIGLIAVQLLRSHGCKVIGIDFDNEKCLLAESYGAKTIHLSAVDDPVAVTEVYTQNQGVDGVIIAAATQSNDPVHQAALMCRQRGRIILVGVVGLQLSRADFYEKELTFQVSCSYGPGRYDASYEQRGYDYPIGFVRWTENRNFLAVLDMMAEGKLTTNSLVSHRFDIESVAEAYQLLTEGKHLGIVLSYPQQSINSADLKSQQTIYLGGRDVACYVSTRVAENAKPCIGFIGAGNYASRILIPEFAKTPSRLKRVVTLHGINSVYVAKKFHIEQASTDTDALLKDPDINTVVIATRHNTHTELVVSALEQGKHVFVEKPLATTLNQINKIREAALQWKLEPPIIMVGFNRRFSPLIQKMKSLLSTLTAPQFLIMTVNAGYIPEDHWTQDKNIGGGRILGEGCHFVDLLRFLVGHPITSFTVAAIQDQNKDNVSVVLSFADGSVGTIHYFANGHKAFPKERLEVFCQGKTLVMNNFRKLTGSGWANFKSKKLFKQNKGQSACVEAFIQSLMIGSEAPIPFEEIMEVSEVTIRISEKLMN